MLYIAFPNLFYKKNCTLRIVQRLAVFVFGAVAEEREIGLEA